LIGTPRMRRASRGAPAQVPTVQSIVRNIILL